jgi:hypothetical protein
MYMCIFFLQRLGVLPPLRALCPKELARLPAPPPLDQQQRQQQQQQQQQADDPIFGGTEAARAVLSSDGSSGGGGGGGSAGGREDVRLLDPRLRGLWVREEALDDLVAAVDGRAADLNRAKQRALAANGSGGGAVAGGVAHADADADGGAGAHAAAAVAAVGHDLTQLLVGFLCYWELPFGAWAEGRHRWGGVDRG